MAYCRNCGTPMSTRAAVCPKCGAAQQTASILCDNGGFGWALLGFLVPIAGLVLYLVWKDTKPRTSAAAGKGALLSTILWVTLCVLLFADLAGSLAM